MMPKNSTLITLRLNNETLLKWDNFCKNQELRRSDLIRTAVNNFISTSSGKTVETLVDELLYNYTKNLSRKIVQDLSLTIKSEIDSMKNLLRERIGFISMLEREPESVENIENSIEGSTKDVDRKQFE